MGREVRLSHIDSVLDELTYPVERETAAREFEDVTLTFSDGERNLGELVSEAGSDAFDSTDELRDEIEGNLPREAVGEPYQSEGEG